MRESQHSGDIHVCLVVLATCPRRPHARDPDLTLAVEAQSDGSWLVRDGMQGDVPERALAAVDASADIIDALEESGDLALDLGNVDLARNSSVDQ